MKNLKNLKFGEISQLSENEMKFVTGGNGSGGICAATSGGPTGAINLCTNDAGRAAEWAGGTGWWCCNCEEAIRTCGSL